MLLLENAQNKLTLTPELSDTIKAVCEYTLTFEGFDHATEISITFVDDEEIKRINMEQRGIDRPTDVLSFPILEFDENGNASEFDIDPDTNEVILGDIVISLERAAAQALEYEHSLKREVAFLTAHSMLHLLGYDHMTKGEELVMFGKQEQILKDLGIERK